MQIAKISKYAQIENDIIEEIKNGTLKPGDKVESESVLKKKYGVSTITVRKAFNDLIGEGYLYGVQGLGTFVTKQQMVRGLTSISFSDELVQQGYEIDVLIDSIETVHDAEVAQKMGVGKDIDLLCIKRVRLAENKPIAYHISYFLKDRFPDRIVDEIRHEKSLYAVLKKNNLYPSWVNEKYSVKEIESNRICNFLNVKKGYPSFYVERTSFDSQDVLFEVAHTYFNKDWYSVTVNIKA